MNKRIFLTMIICAVAAGSAAAQQTQGVERKIVITGNSSADNVGDLVKRNSDKDKNALKRQISPETEKKALELLNEINSDAAQLKSPLLRIELHYRTAEMLWEKDEKRAREIYQSAIDELRGLITKAALQTPETPVDEFYQENTAVDYSLARVRETLLLSLAAKDPQAAFDAFGSLAVTTSKGEDYDPLSQTDDLALTLSANVARKDPQKSFELIKKGLEKGFPGNITTTIKEFQKGSPETAAKTASLVFEKIRSLPVETPNAPNEAEKQSGESLNVWQMSEFFNLIARSYDKTKLKKDEKLMPLLSEADTRELAQIVARRLSQDKSSLAYQLASVYDSLQKFAPAQTAALKKQISASENEVFKNIVENQRNYVEEMTLEDHEKAAENTSDPAEKDMRYAEAASKAIEEEDLEKAQALYSKIGKKDNYSFIADQLKSALPLANAEKADIAETRKSIAELTNTAEKIRSLVSLSNALYQAKRVKDAEQIASEAASLSPSDTRRQFRLQAHYDIARAYAPLDADKSFNMLEGTLGQVNELINAAALVEEFNSGYLMNDGEFTFYAMDKARLMTLFDGTNLILQLSEKNLDRTVGLADQFTRPEVRVYAKYTLAYMLLDADAARSEKLNRRQYSQEHVD